MTNSGRKTPKPRERENAKDKYAVMIGFYFGNCNLKLDYTIIRRNLI